jgi:DNA-binding winged helix-turn-helix (wHTH) protein/tetratricopeptide (TPR) repeat protein
MLNDLPAQPTLRFGPFEWDRESDELRRAGVRIRIQGQPLRLLAVLVERAGHLVTRQELQKQLWPEHTFVDFEDGLNTAIKKLREALGDEREHPQFIETVPRRGYRFVMPVEVAASGTGLQTYPAATPATAAEDGATRPEAETVKAPATRRRRLGSLLAVAAVALAVLGALGVWVLRGRAVFSFSPRDSVLVADFANHTGDARFDEALQTAFEISLRQSRQANIYPSGRVASVLQRMGKSPDEKITPAVGREICQRENIRGLVVCAITRTGQEYELTAELVDPQTGDTVSSHSERSYGEEHILDALDALASAIRRDLGESLYQIHRTGAPLPQVTTGSLVALKQYADGQSLWHRGKFDEAMTLLRGAVATDPDFAMAHAALGNGYYSYIYNQPDKGKQEYEKALSLVSRTADRERLLLQADFADDQQHVSEAETLYRTYLARYPADWNVHMSYARLLRLHHREPEAIEQYEQILRIAPDDAKTYIEMATAYKGLGEFQKAVDAYSRAFRLEPGWLTSGNINREYGFTLVALGQDEKAVQAFTAMLAKPGTQAGGLRSLALLDLYHGRYAAARQRLEQELRFHENRPDPLPAARVNFLLALIAQGEGDSRGEMEHLDASVVRLKEIGPKVLWALIVGQEFARAGAADKAEKLAETVSAFVEPRNSEDAASLHILQAEVSLAKGEANAAIQGLLAPEPEIRDRIRTLRTEALAHAYQQSGQTDQAIAWYEKLMAIPEGGSASRESQQNWLAAYVALASDYAARGEKQKARETLAIFLKRWKDADPNLPLLKQAKAQYAKLQ